MFEYINCTGLVRPNGNISNGINMTTNSFVSDFRYSYQYGVMAYGYAKASLVLKKPELME